jgi:hypothetical protein
MDVTKSIYPRLPHWVAGIYGLLAVITMPWTIYLALTLPKKHLSTHWDVAWVGLDIAIVAMLILNAVYSYLESKWLVMSATATTTLLITDAWFDVTSAHRGAPFLEAVASAVLIELPLAVLTFTVALRIVTREHPGSQ